MSIKIPRVIAILLEDARFDADSQEPDPGASGIGESGSVYGDVLVNFDKNDDSFEFYIDNGRGAHYFEVVKWLNELVDYPPSPEQ
jgi:hypothetical protein